MRAFGNAGTLCCVGVPRNSRRDAGATNPSCMNAIGQIQILRWVSCEKCGLVLVRRLASARSTPARRTPLAYFFGGFPPCVLAEYSAHFLLCQQSFSHKDLDQPLDRQDREAVIGDSRN